MVFNYVTTTDVLLSFDVARLWCVFCIIIEMKGVITSKNDNFSRTAMHEGIFPWPEGDTCVYKDCQSQGLALNVRRN